MERDMSGRNPESITIDQAVAKFVDYAQRFDSSAPNTHWYVGISIDPDRRKKEHEQDKDIGCECFCTLVFCDNKASAKELEDKLEEQGFAKTKKALLGAMESDTANLPHGVYIFNDGLRELVSEQLKRVLDMLSGKRNAYWAY